MNFFKKVVNKQTITDKGTLHHTGDLTEGCDVYQDEDMSEPAVTDTYITAEGQQLVVKHGKVEQSTPVEAPKAGEDDDETVETKSKPVKKPLDVQNRLQEVKARLHAQNALLNEAKVALEDAHNRLRQTREDVKNEIKSDFTPEGSKRSNKAKTEAQPFFAPQSPLAQQAVKKAISR